MTVLPLVPTMLFFHAATAAMLAQGEVFKTHSSVLAAFIDITSEQGELT